MLASATLSSTSYSPFDHPNPTHLLRDDDSFSTYLDLIRQSFSTDLVAPPPTSRRSSMSFRRTDEDELDVFTAERYFSNTLHLKDSTAPQNNIHKHSSSRSNSKTSTTTCKKQQHNSGGWRSRSSAAVSASSRANSQSNLLRDRPQRLAGAGARSGGRRSILGVFLCHCSKDDAVEVEVEDGAADTKPRGGAVAIMSDSSSELFEIESLYSSQQQQTVYAPSEVSIQWSVLTESAANLSVVGSREGLAVVKKRRASGLLTLGCASEKAVNTVSAERVVALERYRAMMEMESASVARAVAARPRRASLG